MVLSTIDRTRERQRYPGGNMTLFEQVAEALASIQARTTLTPAVAIILGSGLGDIATELRDATAIPYTEIPHFAHSTVPGHAGRLLLGMLGGVPTVVMQGRFHFYEGYSLQAITLPVRVMRMLGAHTLIVTNAAGGMNAAYRPGDFMLIRDHINIPGLAGANPLMGPKDNRSGERFPPLAEHMTPRCVPWHAQSQLHNLAPPCTK